MVQPLSSSNPTQLIKSGLHFGVIVILVSGIHVRNEPVDLVLDPLQLPRLFLCQFGGRIALRLELQRGLGYLAREVESSGYGIGGHRLLGCGHGGNDRGNQLIRRLRDNDRDNHAVLAPVFRKRLLLQ